MDFGDGLIIANSNTACDTVDEPCSWVWAYELHR